MNILSHVSPNKKQQFSYKVIYQQLMNYKTPYLSNLNSCFMQMQAYQQHRKKVQEIGQSRIKIKDKIKQNSCDLFNQQNEQGEKDSSIQAVKHSVKKLQKRRMSPKEIRDQYEIRKENSRLMQRIQKCSSTIDRKDILRHQQKIFKIKEQLSRYIYSPLSNRVILRCKHSLQIIKKRQLTIQKSSLFPSRSQSPKRYPKSQSQRLETNGTYCVNQINIKSKKSIVKKLFLAQKLPQIKKNFETADLHQHTKREFQTLKLNFWSNRRKRVNTEIKKPVKIFQTEVE